MYFEKNSTYDFYVSFILGRNEIHWDECSEALGYVDVEDIKSMLETNGILVLGGIDIDELAEAASARYLFGTKL